MELTSKAQHLLCICRHHYHHHVINRVLQIGLEEFSDDFDNTIAKLFTFFNLEGQEVGVCTVCIAPRNHT